MSKATYLKHAAEIWATSGSHPGPTGRFAEVIRGEVQDRGGNVLFSGTADECAAKSFRVPVRLVPTEWRDAGDDVTSDGPEWQMVS